MPYERRYARRIRAVVCADKFKGTLSSEEVCAALAAGLRAAGWEVDELPAADGGEGTAAALLTALGGRWIDAQASDALGRPITARFALLADGTAALDAAEAIGLGRLEPGELDPLTATSRGAGELIAAALDAAPAVVVGAGGTATLDGGAGALAALSGVPAGRVRVACDVRTCWEDAPRLFGPQKGADAAGVRALGERLDRLARSLARDGDVLSPLRVPHTAGRRKSHAGRLRGKRRGRSPGGGQPRADATNRAGRHPR